MCVEEPNSNANSGEGEHMGDREKDILGAWRTLVVKSGATAPRHSMRPRQIYKSWCPDSTTDLNHLKQNRPDLKKILKQSLAGELRREGYPGKIVNNDEFGTLWELVHGDFDPVAEEELKHFARYSLDGIKKEMWEGVDGDTMGRLVTCFMKFKGLENFVKQYHQKWMNWIDEQKVAIDQLEEFANSNPRYAPKGHPVHIEIKEGRQTLTKARKEKASMPKFVDEAKEHLSQDIFDALIRKLKISKMPSWAVKLDGDFIEKSQAVYDLIFSTENDDPVRVAEMALSDWKDAEENQKIWADRMMEAIDRHSKLHGFL